MKDVHANFERPWNCCSMLSLRRLGCFCSNGGSAADCAHILRQVVKLLHKTPLPAELASSIGEDWAKICSRACL